MIALVSGGALPFVLARPVQRLVLGSPPSILVITLDTTRADHLGCYGYEGAETPTLDRLASEGTRYVRAYASAPLTIPAHATLFTGTYPPTHGVRDNGDFVVPDRAVTLAERLSEVGYHTLAFTAAFPTRRRWGLDQGFDVYSDPLADLPTRLNWRDERDAKEVVDDAIAHLEVADGPVFAWVHLFDAHWPYEPPEPWRTRFADRPYDGEIAYTDAMLARLIEAWDARFPDSVVVVTADHGEGLGDSGELTHGFLLHDATLRVPLILRGRGVAQGAVDRDPVGHVDVVPTLLALVGMPVDRSLPGADVRIGGSDAVYSEALTGQFALGTSPLRSYTDAAGRLVDGGWSGWYAADGAEIARSPTRRDAETVVEQARLASMVASFPEPGWEEASLGASERTLLAALGYVGGDPVSPPGAVDPRDVIDVIPKTWRARELLRLGLITPASALIDEVASRMPDAFGVEVLRVDALRAQGRIAEAAEATVALYLRAPTATLALQAADLELSRGAWADAASWYEEALALQPASPEAMAGLARVAATLGDVDALEEMAARFLVMYPDHAELQLILAEGMVADGRPDEGLALAVRARSMMPYDPWAFAVVARCQWARGDANAAIDTMLDAIRLEPYAAGPRVELAGWMLEVGRSHEAVRMIAPLRRLFPDDPWVETAARITQDQLDAERAAGKPSPYWRSNWMLRRYNPWAWMLALDPTKVKPPSGTVNAPESPRVTPGL